MIIYMVGKPRTRWEKQLIAMHDEIVFFDTIEEYHEHRRTGRKPTMFFTDDPLPTPEDQTCPSRSSAMPSVSSCAISAGSRRNQHETQPADECV